VPVATPVQTMYPRLLPTEAPSQPPKKEAAHTTTGVSSQPINLISLRSLDRFTSGQ
jgi:hypothetical protein